MNYKGAGTTPERGTCLEEDVAAGGSSKRQLRYLVAGSNHQPAMAISNNPQEFGVCPLHTNTTIIIKNQDNQPVYRKTGTTSQSASICCLTCEKLLESIFFAR
jgi:hypothetical protein